MSDFNTIFAASFDVAATGSPGMAESFTCDGQTFKAIEHAIRRSTDPNTRGGGRSTTVTGMLYIAWSEWNSKGLAEGKEFSRSDGAYTARIVSKPTLSDPTADVQIIGHATS